MSQRREFQLTGHTALILEVGDITKSSSDAIVNAGASLAARDAPSVSCRAVYLLRTAKCTRERPLHFGSGIMRSTKALFVSEDYDTNHEICY